jgi:formylglycine-generating enzyme required for sulfatase activity
MSYSTADSEITGRVAEDLRQAGFDVWMSPGSIEPGENWVEAIQRGLSNSTHYVLMVSPSAVDSKWVNFELSIAVQRKVAGEMEIIPVKVKETNNLPLFWGINQWIDAEADYDDALAYLIRRINTEQPAAPMAQPVTSQISVNVQGDVTGKINIAGRDVMVRSGPDAGRPAPPLTHMPDTDRPARKAPVAVKTSSKLGRAPYVVAGTVTLLMVIAISYALFNLSNGGRGAGTPTPTETVTTPTDEPTTMAAGTPTHDPGAEAFALAEAGVNNNREWIPYVQDVDGVLMALVPSGCFAMGRVVGGDDDERPVHQQCLSKPFWIDVTEVTALQFVTFDGVAFSAANSGSNYPIASVSWAEAERFCRERRGVRLPSEAEWEFAARGPDNHLYPWGSELDASRAVYLANSDDHTAEVGSKPGGASWVGALDMSGNVWEWVNSWVIQYPFDPGDGRELPDRPSPDFEYRGIRGGAFYTSFEGLTSTNRGKSAPSQYDNGYGFRCAKSY